MADSTDAAVVGSPAEATFVGATLVCLFFALCRGWYTPEVVVSSSLIAVLFELLLLEMFCLGIRCYSSMLEMRCSHTIDHL